MKTHGITGLREPAENLVDAAQELLAATAHLVEEKVIDARKRLTEAVETGKDAWRAAQAAAISKAKATDRVIRDHPYHSIGIALGAGMLLGFLARRRD